MSVPEVYVLKEVMQLKKYWVLVVGMITVSLVVLGTSNWTQQKQEKMKVVVWDTYVKKKDGVIMHFDILAPITIVDEATIHEYGKQYLAEKGQEGQLLSAKECRRCHVETMKPAWEADIEKKGYYIIEMENCN
mgnify:CR=1 FL=1